MSIDTISPKPVAGKDIEFMRIFESEIRGGKKVWKDAIWSSGLYAHEWAIDEMLHDCLNPGDSTELWGIRHVDSEGVRHLDGVIVTKIFLQPYTGIKTLTLMHANTTASLDDFAWERIHAILLTYAAGEDCNIIEVYSEHPRAQAVLDRLGFARVGVFQKEISHAS